MARYAHYLGIGATGMLATASRHFAEQSDTETLIARDATGFVRSQGLDNATAVDADWGDVDRYIRALSDALAGRPGVELCVLWLHGGAEGVLDDLLDLLSPGPCRLIHVLGSSSGDPRERAEALRKRIRGIAGLTCHSVMLGAVGEGIHRRWLTHDEISRGVIDCEREGRDVVVGELPQ